MRRVSYSETERVEIEGASFDLCSIPAHKWTEIRLRARRALLRAKRAGLASLRESGVDSPSEEDVVTEAWLDPEYRREYESAIRETVAWGVRGHTLEGVPFVAASRDCLGRSYAGASDETVGAYSEHFLDAGGTLLEALYLRVSQKNSVSPAEKKS